MENNEPFIIAPEIERKFWALVNKNGPIPSHRPDLGPCWLWKGSVSNGYGIASIHGVSVGAYRVSYFLVKKKKVKKGMELDHLCRVTLCINPYHLEPVTHRENMLRGNTLFAKKAKQTHCYRGHPFTKENTIFEKSGSKRRPARRCKLCKKLRRRKVREIFND